MHRERGDVASGRTATPAQLAVRCVAVCHRVSPLVLVTVSDGRDVGGGMSRLGDERGARP